MAPSRKLNQWVYVYYLLGDKIIYDRTLARDGLQPYRLEEVLQGFKARGVEAFYTIGRLVGGEVYS